MNRLEVRDTYFGAIRRVNFPTEIEGLIWGRLWYENVWIEMTDEELSMVLQVTNSLLRNMKEKEITL